MTTLNGPICDFCRASLVGRPSYTDFFFTQERFCTPACLEKHHAERKARWRRMEPPTIRKYGTRHWAVYDGNGELIAVTVYKKGAEEVKRRLTAKK